MSDLQCPTNSSVIVKVGVLPRAGLVPQLLNSFIPLKRYSFIKYCWMVKARFASFNRIVVLAPLPLHCARHRSTVQIPTKTKKFVFSLGTSSLRFTSLLVPRAGLEPACLKGHGPQPCVYTKFHHLGIMHIITLKKKREVKIVWFHLRFDSFVFDFRFVFYLQYFLLLFPLKALRFSAFPLRYYPLFLLL